jgi:hypothetical protein
MRKKIWPEVVCAYRSCGKTFRIQPSRLDLFANHYCGAECRRAALRLGEEERRARRRASRLAWWRRNKQRHAEYTKKWRALNPDKVKAQGRRQRLGNLEKRRQTFRVWRLKNLEARKAKESAHMKANRPYYTMKVRERDAMKRNATPKWADHRAIRLIYEEASRAGMHVDHIVPLISDRVCGLHWEGNLQLLSPKENASKKNYRWPGMVTEAA